MRRHRFDLATVLVIGMGLALLPSFFTSEITIGRWTFGTDRLMLGYFFIAMSAIGVSFALEARRVILGNLRRRQYWLAAFHVLIWGVCLLMCCAFIWTLFLWVKA
ncbi:MAG: hypothetical protein GY708_11865 [Actinomycetia bacterium]|nr:hypothetical protein [Actinomycetes bacterium]